MNPNVDVLIIGGGSIGLNAAYYLLKAGRRVTLIERNTVAQGSSSGNAGHIVPSHIVPLAAPGIIPTALNWMLTPATSPFSMRFSLDPAYLGWLLRFAFACTKANVERAIPPLTALGLLSARNFATLIAAEKFDCHYQESGLLFLYKTAKAFAEGQHEAELLHRYGLPAAILDHAAVHTTEPTALPDVLGGVHFTGDASLNPATFLRLLAARVRALGGDLLSNITVTGFSTTRGAIRAVHTTTGDFTPEHIVLAAGAWSPAVARGLGLNIPVQPARGYSLTMAATQTMPRQALLLGERRVAVTPLGALLRFTGRLELSNHDTTPNPKHIAGIEQAVREYIQLDPKLDIQETWAGLRPTTPDGLPIIGRSPKHRNLTIATGHAMLGLSLGPGTGETVAALVTGTSPSFNLDPLRVERFG